jgi:hypothetical protein
MKPQLGSRTGVVVDRILTILRAVPADPDPNPFEKVEILDGPSISEGAYEQDVIQVGPGDPGEPAVVVQRRPEPGLGRQAYRESTEVTMLISCFNGDTNVKAVRDRAIEVFDAIKQRLDAHLVEPGAWDSLRLGEGEVWFQVQDENGCTVWVGFTLVAESIV